MNIVIIQHLRNKHYDETSFAILKCVVVGNRAARGMFSKLARERNEENLCNSRLYTTKRNGEVTNGSTRIVLAETFSKYFSLTKLHLFAPTLLPSSLSLSDARKGTSKRPVVVRVACGGLRKCKLIEVTFIN